MELRCDWRSTNISETSRFGYSISYIVRLMAVSSTENAQCGVLPSIRTIYISTGSAHVALPAKDHAQNNILRIFLATGLCAFATSLTPASLRRPWRPTPPATGGWQDGVADIRVAECGGSMWGAVVWEKVPGGHDKQQSRCLKAEQAHPGNADPARHEEEGRESTNGKAKSTTPRTARPTVPTIKPIDPDQLEIQGCVLGFLCGGETWTRVAGPIPSSPANSMAKGAPKSTSALPKTGAAAPKPPPRRRKMAGQSQPRDIPPIPVGDICLLPDIARFTH